MRKKAQKTAPRNGAERNNQYYLFGCLCHGGYKLYSLLCGTKPKQNKNKQKCPKSQKSSEKECKKSHRTTDPDGGDKHARLSLMHIELRYLKLCFSVAFTYWPDGDLRNGQAINLFLPLRDFPFPLSPSPGWESFSSVREVLLMTMGEGMKQDFQNTDFASLEALLRAATQLGGGRQGSLTELRIKKEKERKTKTKPPQSVFSQTKGETEGWHGLQGDPHS